MRVSCIYDMAGTITYRLASRGITANFMTGDTWGSNLQNIEKSVRRLYVPDKGYKFVQVDQYGAEALIVSKLARKGKFASLFEYDVKPHVFVALHLFSDVWDYKVNEHGGSIRIDIKDLLDCPIEGLRTHPHFKPVERLIKASDNWSAKERYYYIAKQVCHCVDDETEVLVEGKGWINIAKISPEDKIAISDMNRNISFECPSSWNKAFYEGLMYSIEQDEASQLVTPNHRIVYQSNNKLHIKFAHELEKYSYLHIPNSGFYVGGCNSLHEDDIKLLVAIQADGHITGKHNVRFGFRKERKIERLLSIIKNRNYRHTIRIRNDGATEIYVVGISNLIKFFDKKDKKFGSWLLQFSYKNLSTLIEELKFWDGHFEKTEGGRKREEYFTAKKENAEWIKTICHLVGKQGTLNYYIKNESKLYVIGINRRQYARSSISKYKNYKGMVYCPTVSTGMFVIRRHGKITITMNSHNYDIRPNTFRMNVLEKSRGKIVLTKEQAEKYGAFYRQLFPEIYEWHADVRRQLDETRTLYNLFGYPRIFTGELNERSVKEAYAFIPQSTVGCITHWAIIKLQSFIEESNLDWDILANTHDSYLVQCPIEQELECARIMTEFMNQELVAPSGEVFRMRSEAQSGFNWAPYKEHKNDLGLKELVLN